MLRRVAEGGVGAVVVHKIDRLARSMEDHVAIRATLRHAGVQLVSVTENIEETASGRLVEGIHALMAEFYSANLAGEIRKGMTQKAKMGGWPTKAPIGYLNVREKTAGKDIAKVILDPERALLVRATFRLYATGEYSLPELQATMHAKGLTSPHTRRPGAPVSVSKLAELLTNPFYVGVVQWGGAHYEGQHKALIPQSLFDRVQETLRSRDVAGVRQRRHEHYLKGLLFCGECGRRLSLTLAKGRYLYFYCLGQRGTARTGCRQPYIVAGDAEALVEDLYGRIQLPPSWVSRLTEELEAEILERQAEASERRVVLTRTLAKATDERGKLLQAFYANAIPLDLLKSEQDRIGVAEHAAKDELQATEGDLEGWQDVLRTAIRLAGNCHAAYPKARPSVRRRFNDAVLEAVYIRDRMIGRVEFSEVFAHLFSRPSSNKALKVDPRGFEPLTFWLPAKAG
jgi:site-specific DNA recombinase